MKWISDTVVSRLQAAVDQPDLSETKYRLVQKIARGGMGTVYLADDIDLGRRVALKVMSVQDLTGDLGARMMNEARIIARLEHPAIVPVHDVGTLPDGRVFYTMKYVQGDRLDQYAIRCESLPELLRTFQKVCDAVAFAHAHGVIHRDLKPENIMVGAFGEVQVMDWGVSKVFSQASQDPAPSVDSSETIAQENSDQAVPEAAELQDTISPPPLIPLHADTQKGTIMGTPAYMSPEQTMGDVDHIDERSDVYSLGSILYFLLTGHSPFEGSSIEEIRKQIASHSLIRPRQRDSRIKRPIEAICLKAMSEERTRRYPDVQELSTDVASYLDDLPVQAYRENLFERLARWLSKNQFLVILILAYLLMRFVVLIWAKP